MAAVERPFPPGDYDVVVVGSGPGGLQTSYFLRQLGIRHALLSRDERPGGMFQRFPIFQRLITWTKPDAPVERGSREYEWYDHNSLLAEEPELKALVPALMDRAYDLPSRAEMEAGLCAFAERAGLEARYGCTWESTRYEGEQLVLETSDGEYRCRAAVFALGVTEPWRAEVPGLEHAAHYVDTRDPARYEGRDVFVVGKRNSGFEVAQGILPWARSIVLGSPRPVQTDALALSALRVRYLHPYDEYARGGPGTYVIDVSIERIERIGERLRVVTRGTTWDGTLEFEVDDVIAATGFPGAASGSAAARARHRRRRAHPGADAVLGERLAAGRLLRRERVAGRAGHRQARRRRELHLRERLPLQRARAGPAPRGTARLPGASARERDRRRVVPAAMS